MKSGYEDMGYRGYPGTDGLRAWEDHARRRIYPATRPERNAR